MYPKRGVGFLAEQAEHAGGLRSGGKLHPGLSNVCPDGDEAGIDGRSALADPVEMVSEEKREQRHQREQGSGGEANSPAKRLSVHREYK